MFIILGCGKIVALQLGHKDSDDSVMRGAVGPGAENLVEHCEGG